MKKLNFFTVVISCILMLCCKQSNKEKKIVKTVKTDGIKGRVKVLQISTYTLIANSSTPQKGKLFSKMSMDYDSLGNRTITTMYNEMDSVISQTITKLEYDKNGRIVLQKDFRNDSLGDYVKFEYNNNGQNISQTWYRPDNTLNFILKYIYDKNGNQIEEKKIDSDGSMISKYTSSYDDDKNVVNRKNYDYNGELQFSNGFKYDKNRNQIELAHFDKEGSLTLKNSTEYDEGGNVTRIKKNVSNIGMVQVQEFKYDNFDKNQNPVVAIISIDGKPAGISESKIKYY